MISGNRFTTTDAIWIGSIQNTETTDEELQEKLASMSFDEPDVAAFTETCKLLAGSIERAAKACATPQLTINPDDSIQTWES